MPSDTPHTGPAPSFFNGRFMVEIEEWNWGLYVGLSHPGTPRRYRFQGGLMYNRGIDLAGRIRAPAAHRGEAITIWISPFDQKVRFNARSGDVGRFYRNRVGEGRSPFEANLRLPQDALSNSLICLGSVWKLMDIWTASDEPETLVTAFCFSPTVHWNIAEWAGPALEPR